MIKRVLFFSFLLFCFAATLQAQYKPNWINKVKETIEQKETDWKIDNQTGYGEKETWNQSFHLKSGIKTASVEISYLNAANFEESFEDQINTFSKTIGKGTPKRKLQNFGDGGYIWTFTGGWTMIQAKKGKFIVRAAAPTETLAKRLAKYAFDQMPHNGEN
ncbi:MAG: hypothetical protein M3209_03810 [Acidobacteriota bacterium]|nr:hypothetical protein [Acidobacteriota bacterium]